MNAPPYNNMATGYANGYIPSTYTRAANSGFWGILLDEGWMPSELFCRLSDAIFFYLDANAQASYQNSGYIEPDKNMWWSTYLQTVQQEKAVTDYIAKHAMGGLYDAISVPYEVVTLKDGSTMPVLNRSAFLNCLVASAKTDPPKFLQKLNKSIINFNLTDPATNQPFPGPIPATAMPMVCDWVAQSAFRNWQMSVGAQYRVHAFQKTQKRRAQAHMVHNVVHTLTGGLGGGGGGFGGFGGFGGGLNGYGV